MDLFLGGKGATVPPEHSESEDEGGEGEGGLPTVAALAAVTAGEAAPVPPALTGLALDDGGESPSSSPSPPPSAVGGQDPLGAMGQSNG